MLNLVLISCLAVSCYTDIKWRTISNYLTFGLMAFGLIYNTWIGPGLSFSLTGIAAGFILLLLPFLLTGMGAGDVKLMMGVGAVLGWQYTIYIGILSSIVFAIYAVLKLTIHGKGKELFYSTKGQATYILTKAHVKDFNREYIEGTTIPYAVPITISTLIVLLWGWW